MLTWPPSWYARSRTRPAAALPVATRASGDSIPWSIELRTACVSGSRIASMIVRSSSVSAPSRSSATCFPHPCDRSRTSRGSLFHALPIGCIRVFITPSCSSVVSKLRRAEAFAKPASLIDGANCKIWLRARTSSPTRFMTWSSSSTSTRMALSVTVERAGPDSGGEDSAVAVLAACIGGGVDSAGAGTDSTTSSGAASGTATTGAGGGSAGSLAAAASVSAGGGDEGSAATGAAVLGAAFGFGASTSAIFSSAWRSGVVSSAPSLPSDSRWARMSRIASTVLRSTSVIAASISSFPSRSRLRTFSPRCASVSSFGSPRKPQVPLIVWTMRKIVASVSRLDSPRSSASSSPSSRSRFS